MDTMKRVNELLQERGLSMYRLAKISGIPYSTLKNALQRNGQFTVDTLEQVCNAMNISLSDFFKEHAASI